MSQNEYNDLKSIFFQVLARKSQLEDHYVDNQDVERKRREVEAWLSRMEAWLARMAPVGSAADVLEGQIREQKVLFFLFSQTLRHCSKGIWCLTSGQKTS